MEEVSETRKKMRKSTTNPAMDFTRTPARENGRKMAWIDTFMGEAKGRGGGRETSR